jgi:hypothetical protein
MDKIFLERCLKIFIKNMDSIFYLYCATHIIFEHVKEPLVIQLGILLFMMDIILTVSHQVKNKINFGN